MIGPHFSGNEISVGLAFSVQVLIARFIGTRRHAGHPEVIGIGSEGIKGLLEGDFDFESEPIDSKDVQRGEGQIGGHEDFGSMLGVDDQDKADQNAHGAPKKIDGTIPYRDMGFTVGRAGCLDEAGKVLEQGFEFDLRSVFSFRPSSFFGVGQGWPISHGILTDLGDQMVAAVKQAMNDHFAGVIGVQNQVERHGNRQGADQVDHFIQQAFGLPV